MHTCLVKNVFVCVCVCVCVCVSRNLYVEVGMQHIDRTDLRKVRLRPDQTMIGAGGRERDQTRYLDWGPVNELTGDTQTAGRGDLGGPGARALGRRAWIRCPRARNLAGC